MAQREKVHGQDSRTSEMCPFWSRCGESWRLLCSCTPPHPSSLPFVDCLHRTLPCTASIYYWQKFAFVDCVLQSSFNFYSIFKSWNTKLINILQLVINALESGKESSIATYPFNSFPASQTFHYQIQNVTKIYTTSVSSAVHVISHSLCKLNLKLQPKEIDNVLYAFFSHFVWG